LRRLLQRDPSLASEYSPLGFAVREGHLEAVQVLLGAGANPDQMASGGECAAILLEAGGTISARDDEYRSRPLAWAARNDLPDMVEFLLAKGAPANLPDDPAWATLLAWATRRGHARIAEMLRRTGAVR
jgi:ankyrin repeat protein